MAPKKIIVFLGTRPEAIKLAPVIALLKANSHFNTLVCSTGQHKEMLQQVTDFFGFPVDISLDVMENNQQLAGLTAKLLTKISEVLAVEKPDFMMVQGDTTTTFAASLAAFYNKIKVLHVEAGLRTFNKFSPFPEEINRVFTTRLADFHYAPTELARQNLLNEGVADSQILVTGNTVVDALYYGLKKLKNTTPQNITALNLHSLKKYILVTIHRREKHGIGLKNLCLAVKKIAEASSIPVIFPVHLNPNVKRIVHDILGNHPLIHLTAQFSYPEFLWLLSNSYMVITDSGGVQDEAPLLGKPVLLVRDVTERPEAVEAGIMLQTNTDPELIYKEAMKVLTNKQLYNTMSTVYSPCGDGRAAERIVDAMLQFCNAGLATDTSVIVKVPIRQQISI